MRRSALIFGVAFLASTGITPAEAQLAIGARAGTTGVGGEVSFGIMPRLSLRGTATVIPFEPTFEVDGAEYTADPPSPLFTVGADFSLGVIRLFGGVLFGLDEFQASRDYSGSVEFGGRTYTGNGTILGAIEASSAAPFLGIGFGKTLGSGIGINFDLGAAIMGETDVSVRATGPISQQPDYETQRAQEEEDIQEQVDKYLKFFPMISIGLRIGIGG